MALLPFIEMLLKVLLPFLWDKVTEERTATVVETTDEDRRIISKIQALRHATP